MIPKVTVADGASGRHMACWIGTGIGRMAGFGGGNAMAMAFRVGVVDLDCRRTRAEGVHVGDSPGYFRVSWAIPSRS